VRETAPNLLGDFREEVADVERMVRNGNDVGGGDGVGGWSNSGMGVSIIFRKGAEAAAQTFSDIVISLKSFIVVV
jgi:hypothetical protein